MRSMKLKQFYFIIGLFFATNIEPSSFRTTLNNADPNPFYNSKFPFEPMYGFEKDYLNNRTCVLQREHMYISASPFFQQASKGNNQYGKQVELGDLTGRWNMIAVLPFNDNAPGFEDYLTTCITSTDYPTTECKCISYQTLVSMRSNMLDCIASIFGEEAYPDALKSVQGLLELQNQVQLLGFFSVPIKYKKKGIRFQTGAMLGGGFGISFDLGVSNVSQSASFIDLSSSTTCLGPETCLSGCPTATRVLINCLNPFPRSSVNNDQWQQVVGCIHRTLMNNIKIVAQAINLNICDYNKTSLEDIHAELFWRQAIPYNTSNGKEWPRFLLVPFFHLGGTWANGAVKDYDQQFSLPSGNNGHNEIDFLAGCGFDFADTIEVGGEAGFVHFNCTTVNCFRMPNNVYQNNIYPYQTAVTVKPGDTWHIGLFMNARNFLEHWSCWAQYAYINHTKDTITLQEPDEAFHPDLLECRSEWSVQVLNAGLNYDISPQASLGVFAQIPLARQNAYRSTSVLGNLTLTF